MRKILAIIAAVFFICGFVQISKESDTKSDPTVYTTPVQTTVPQEEQKVYTVKSETPFENDKERFVAHRGFSHHAPENSLPAFEMAGKSGFWGIETDIVETKDGVFVCMHDETLDRTTNGHGKVSDYSYAELMNYSLHSEGIEVTDESLLKIPAMVEFLNTCVINDCIPILEVKKVTDYEGFLQTIKNSGLYHRSIIAGDIDAVREIRNLDSEIALFLVAYATLDYSDYEPYIPEIGKNGGLLLNSPLITEEVAKDLHAQGLKIGAWTLDTDTDAQKYLDLGADFVVTNTIPGLNHMINENE